VALVLLYLVVLVLVAIVLFGAASLLFGRGEQLPPLPRGTTVTVLPAFGVTGADVDAVKFTQVLRGYKSSEVDWVLDRLGRELEALRGQLAAVHAGNPTFRGLAAETVTSDLPEDEAVVAERPNPT
jgi:DivIVA domain-containing protein